MDKYIVKVNHYPRYKFYEEFLPHHLFEILGTNKMNWLIKTYTQNYSVWFKIKLEKSASKGNFFPKVIKVCFFCFSYDSFTKKKIISLILFFSSVWQNRNQTLKEKSWTSSDYHRFYHFIMYKVRFEKIYYLCHWLIFFKSNGGKNHFPLYWNHVQSGFAYFISCKKKTQIKISK